MPCYAADKKTPLPWGTDSGASCAVVKDLNGTGGTTANGEGVRGCLPLGMGSRPVQNFEERAVRSDPGGFAPCPVQ